MGSGIVIHNFDQKYQFSIGTRKANDIESIKQFLDGCKSVRKSSIIEDKLGIDYFATLHNGADVLIDVKARECGASKFWNGRPEFALETWSVMPGGKYRTPNDKSKRGWTLSTSSPVDYILFTFAPHDCNAIYFVPFQILRVAFGRNLQQWSKVYHRKTQETEMYGQRWESECLFIPDNIVYQAITIASMHFVLEKPMQQLEVL